MERVMIPLDLIDSSFQWVKYLLSLNEIVSMNVKGIWRACKIAR